VRGALGGITRRGASLLVAGLALLLAGLLAGSTDLLRVGVLLLALPLVAAATVARTRYRVACSRSLDPPRVAAGDPSRVLLRLENVTRLPTTVLLAEDHLPPRLGGRPRFTLDRVEAGGVRSATYQVRAAVRGRFTVGPLTVRLTDPFGLCELVRSFAATDDLVVTPVVEPLPAVRLGGEWTGGGESRSRSVSSTGDDDIATRAYRQGDDLRRVHWRSTARVGELMVRREEQPWSSRAVLLLDGRAGAHRGDGPSSSYEAAISIMASVGVHLSRRGYALRTLRDDGAETSTGSPAVAEGLLLEGLATAAPSRGASLQPALGRLGGGAAREGLVIAICGQLDEHEARDLARARGTGTGIALLLDVTTWTGPTRGPRRLGTGGGAQLGRAADLLVVAGWRVVVLRRGDSLAEAWPRAGAGDPRGASPFADRPAPRDPVVADAPRADAPRADAAGVPA